MGFFELFSSALAGFYAVIPSYGFGIILLTIVVRLVLLPLSIKQTRSMREMQRIQPEVKKIQAKHKGDRQKMNEEMMKLYKEHGVNPLGGCLPLLLQFPVLIGLFYVVRSPLDYMGYQDSNPDTKAIVESWVEDPSSDVPDVIKDSGLAGGLRESPLSLNSFLGLRLDCSSALALNGQRTPIVTTPCGDGLVEASPYLALVVLMGATTWYQSKQMQAQRGGASDQMQQQAQLMTKIMPVLLMVIGFSFPTGVLLYWITTNLWTIGQQRLMLASAAHVAEEMAAARGAQTKRAASSGTVAAEKAQKEGATSSRRNPSSSKKKKRR